MLVAGLFAASASATAPSNVGLPAVSGSFAIGQALAASEGDWVGSQPLSLAYKWQRCTPYKEVALAASPAAYWRLGEAQGSSTAADQAASPDTGTYMNVPTLGQWGPLSGDSDRAARFDGSGAFVDVADASKLKPASAFSLEAWVKTTASNGVIVDKPYTAGALVSYSLSIAVGKAKVAVDLSGSHSYSLSSTASVNDGQWHHLVGTFGSSSLKLYVDGTAVGSGVSTTGSLQYSTQKLQMGRFDGTAGSYLAGTVDEVAVYPTALSATQVSDHYAAGTTANGVDANCSDISGATSSLYTPGSSDLGKRLRVKVTASNGDGSASAVSLATVITAASPANLDAPDVSGTAQDGQTLAGGTGTWSGATPITFGYQWQRCTAYRSAVAADVPLGYWRLGEASGTAAGDLVGENGGTYVGSPSLGLAGALVSDASTAVAFDGSTQQLTLSHDVGFGSGDFTIEAWFKSPVGSGSQTIWRSGDNGTGSAWAELALVNGQLRGKVKGSNTVTATSASTYTDGAWHQGVFTRTGTNFALYVDGAQVATASGSAGGLDTSGASTVIGASVSGSNRFSGVLDEIAAYTSALSSARVLAHYNARNAPCANVGTNSSSYTLGSADVGSSALVGVTASNSAGSATASSLPLLVAAKTKPASVNPPTIGGNSPVVGQVVTADPGSWDQAASYTYQWRRCTPYANVVAQDTPVDEWRLGERDASKIIAADNVGTSKGSYQGGPLYGFGGALAQDTDSAVYFDGDSSQSVSIAKAPAFGSGPFTVEAWFRSTKTSGQYEIWYSGKTGSVQITLLDGKLQASASDGTNGVTLTSSTPVYADGAWHQVAFTRSGTSFLLYADGAQLASGTKTMNAVGDPDAVADIGAKEGGTNYFTGAIDEVAAYTSALSLAQVAAHRSSALDPCTNLSGQVTSTYTVASADAGLYLSVRVGATNSAGTGYADSPLTLAAPVGSPINTAAPKITGTVAIGQTLTASTGSWTGSGNITYGYQWQRCDGYALTVSADSPLRWYRLDDMSTGSAVDDTGNSTAGSYSGSPRFGIAGALAYEPSTGVTLNVSDDANPPPPDQAATLPTVQLNSGDFTVEGWFKRADSSGATQRIWMSGSGQTLTRYVSLYVSNGNIKSKATDGTSSIDLSGTKIPNDDDWHHAAFTRSGSTFTLYLDALQVATGTQSLGDVDSDGQPAYIGRSADGTQYFVGSVDEVAVYASALNATRIQARVKNAYLNCSDISGATNQTYPVASIDRNRRLNVKVTATNSSGSTSKLSDQTDSLHDPKLTLDIPVDGGIARSLTPTLKVNGLSGSGPYDYAIELSDSDTFEKTIAASGWQTSTTTWTVPSGAELKDGKSYYWRARARYTGATTLWSKPRSLQVKVKRLGLNDAWPMWKAGPLAVNEATGNLVLSLPGPSYASVADGFSVSATYNSLDSTDNGLGAGWTLNAGRGAPAKLWDHAHANEPQDQFDSAEVIWADGSSDFFSHVGNANSRIYKAPTGSSMYLSKNGDGSWTLNDNQGSTYSFGAASGGGIAKLLSAEITAGAPGKAKLTYTYNDSPLRLTQITDPAGRTLTLNWYALTPASCAGALLCVTGPDNVTWRYVGDGTGGISGRIAKVNDGTRDLLQITYANGKPTQIQNANDLDPSHASPGYNSSHKVGITYTNNLVTQVDEGPITGQTPSTSTWSFAYHSGPTATSATAASHGELAAGTARSADGYTEITPPRQQPSGLRTTVYYDDLDHPIDTLDLLGHHTRSSYTRSDQLEWTEDPDGNPTDYSYDPVTNALLSKSNPNPAGGSPLTTSYRYDELAIGTAQTTGPALQGLHAAYFANATLSGRPAVDQTDPQVDFNWGTSGPAALGGRSDNYSVRWTGILTIPAGGEGDYTFSTLSDGNTSLVIGQTEAIDGDDQSTVITDPHEHTLTSVYSQPVHLKPGKHTLTLEYTELTGNAEIHLRYSCATCSPALTEQTIPGSALAPNWQNQTSTVSPGGRITFSHYNNPITADPDYTEQKLNDGTPVITTYAYDDYGRPIRKISPRGNAALTVGPDGNLNGAADTNYATTWSYYALTDTAGPPAFCGGTGVNQAGLLKQTTPPATTATTTVYDAAGRTIANTDTTGTVCTTYSNEGRKTASKDANGHTTSYTYDPAGQVRTVTAADSVVTTTVYDESGAVKSKTDGNNHTITYAHDAEGNQTSITDPLSHTTTTAYDELGRKTSTTDPLSHTTSFAYDNEGRLTTTTTPLGNVSGTGYDTLGRVTTKTDANNHSTSYGYDADGNQTSVTDPLSHTSTTSYDALGRAASKTDANNHTTSFAYDLDGNQVSVTDALSHTTTYGFDAAGRKTTQTDPLNHTTFYEYDGAGRQVSTTNPANETTQTAYDAAGNVVSTSDAAGKTTSYTYDAVNRQASVTTPLGETTSYGYDGVGNKTSMTDPLGKVTSYAFDAADRPTTTTVDTGSGHLNLATSLAYDNAGRLTSTTDPNSHTTSYSYDDDGRRTSVTGQDGSSTTQTYDDVGNVLTRTDDNNHTTTFTYDAADRLASKTDPLSREWTYEYDPVGNKTQVTDANGNATTGDSTDGITNYSYDAADRLTNVDYSDSTPDITYAYDSTNRKTSVTDGAGTQSYGYDNTDRVTSITRGSSGFAYTYDSAGRLSTRIYPDGTATGYAYDNDSRISTVTVGSNTTGYSYDDASRVTATAYPNGWTEQRTYDAAGRLSDIRSTKTGSSDLAVATYTRDGAGNPTTIVRDGVTETYSYDTADRVTAACYGGAVSTCASGSKITYTYDKVGNRLTQTKFGTTTNYKYDAADELCWSGPNTGSTCTTPSGDTADTYDNNGQQTGEGTKTYTYDLAGHLLEADDGSNVFAAYTYDGNDNRLTKTANSITTDYHWDENNDLPMLATESQSGSTLRSYLYGDRLLAMNTGGSAYYFHHDALDTTAVITNSSAATEWTYTYDPYGVARSTTKVDPAAPDNPIQYTGELVDPETGLYDLRARAYGPADGRFLGSDPLAQDAKDPALSTYLYAHADPMVLTDPSGQRVCLDEDNCWLGAPTTTPPPHPSTTSTDDDGSEDRGGGGDGHTTGGRGGRSDSMLPGNDRVGGAGEAGEATGPLDPPIEPKPDGTPEEQAIYLERALEDWITDVLSEAGQMTPARTRLNVGNLQISYEDAMAELEEIFSKMPDLKVSHPPSETAKITRLSSGQYNVNFRANSDGKLRIDIDGYETQWGSKTLKRITLHWP